MESRRFKERLGDFDRALSRLTEGLALDSDSSIVVDGCIQRFEFTYELSWNTMKAYLEYQGLPDLGTPRDVIRESYRIGLIEDGDAWLDMMTDRNLPFPCKVRVWLEISTTRFATSIGGACQRYWRG